MARKVPVDETPFSPVKSALVSAVAGGPEQIEGRNVARGGDEELPRTSCQSFGPARVPLAPASPSRLDREKRVLLSLTEEAAMNRLVQRLAESGATSVRLSHLLRALVRLVGHVEGELVERVRRATDLVRPSNGDATALAEYEHRLAQEVAAAVRFSPPML